jgi:hypothetical protein
MSIAQKNAALGVFFFLLIAAYFSVSFFSNAPTILLKAPVISLEVDSVNASGDSTKFTRYKFRSFPQNAKAISLLFVKTTQNQTSKKVEVLARRSIPRSDGDWSELPESKPTLSWTSALTGGVLSIETTLDFLGFHFRTSEHGLVYSVANPSKPADDMIINTLNLPPPSQYTFFTAEFSGLPGKVDDEIVKCYCLAFWE